MLSMTSVNESGSFEKHQQVPCLCSEVSWCLCNADDSGSDYIGLDWLHIAYKLFLNLCSILLAGGRRSSLTIIHPSIFILGDRSFCNRGSVMCCSIWTLSPEGKQKNTPFRFPCGPQSLSCSTKTPTLLPLSCSVSELVLLSRAAAWHATGCLCLVGLRRANKSFYSIQDEVWNTKISYFCCLF